MKSVLRLRDLAGQALNSVLARPVRAGLTALGVVLGVGAFVAVLGLTATASGQIGKRFNALAATEVTVQDVGAGDDGAVTGNPNDFPADADRRAERITGVRSAGVSWAIGFKTKPTVAGVSLPGKQNRDVAPVVAASPGLLMAIRPTVAMGVLFNDFHDARAEHVAVLGSAAAGQLGITDISTPAAIFVDGIPFTVIGIISDVQRRPELLASVLIPRHTAETGWGAANSATPPTLLVDTDLGAAQVVAAQLAVALRPEAPRLFKVVAPPDPHTLKDQVNNDLGALFLVLAGVCLVIGAVGIANTTMVAIMERIGEIGLRRALGARPRHIAGQFLAESALLGLTGGLLGTGAGMAVTVAVAAARHWTPIVATWVPISAPLAGILIGVLAGAYPALRAARIEPVTALQR